MTDHRLHVPSYLLGVALMLALLWSLARWHWALLVTLCLLPWVLAFVLAYATAPLLAGEHALTEAARAHPSATATPPANGLYDERSPDARWL
jgi:hypothetical protein